MQEKSKYFFKLFAYAAIIMIIIGMLLGPLLR